LGAIGAGVGVGVVGSLVAGDLDVETSDRIVVLEEPLVTEGAVLALCVQLDIE